VIQPVSPQQAHELIQGGSVDVIDVREPHEWQAGHLAVARLVPLATFRRNPSAAVDHDGVLFVCAAGVRSETAARLAVGLGLKRVYNLTGGTRAWSNAGFPLEQESNVTAAE
jgi:rhodanese-related sulfurtransferase